MKMRIVSIVFCLIAFTVSLVLMFNIYNGKVAPTLPGNDDNPIDTPVVEQDRAEPLSDTGIKKLSSDINAFIKSLAYESDKSYNVKMQDYITQLERSADYLATEKQDAAGKEYIYTRLPGVTHNAWDYTYKAELIDWLLSKHKS